MRERGVYDEGDQSDGLELPPADAHFAPREGVLLPPEAELKGGMLAVWEAGWGVLASRFWELASGGGEGRKWEVGGKQGVKK